jgi:2-polyprenyl-3-methyl-5-hydroxy-6-metoxy-1,4-benzoquinol methylase
MPVTLADHPRLAPGRTACAQFNLRTHCVNCHSTDLVEVWSGRFSEAEVSGFIEQFHYAGNTPAALGDATFSLVKCSHCDMMFHQQVLTDTWLSTLYGEWIDSRQIDLFESRASAEQRAAARFERGRQRVKHLLRLDRLLGSRATGRSLLDFGCGDGEFLNMASLFGFEAYGVDFSITRAERQQHRQITVAPTLAELDMLQRGSFDAMTLFETLEHVPDPGGLLQALHARLAPAGILIVEVPNCQGLSVPTTLDEFHALQPLEHINNFTPQTLHRMCERHGFVRITKPVAHVTTQLLDVARSQAGRFVRQTTTQQYFRRR